MNTKVVEYRLRARRCYAMRGAHVATWTKLARQWDIMADFLESAIKNGGVR